MTIHHRRIRKMPRNKKRSIKSKYKAFRRNTIRTMTHSKRFRRIRRQKINKRKFRRKRTKSKIRKRERNRIINTMKAI